MILKEKKETAIFKYFYNTFNHGPPRPESRFALSQNMVCPSKHTSMITAVSKLDSRCKWGCGNDLKNIIIKPVHKV
jgi:hypothetical protein